MGTRGTIECLAEKQTGREAGALRIVRGTEPGRVRSARGSTIARKLRQSSAGDRVQDEFGSPRSPASLRSLVPEFDAAQRAGAIASSKTGV